MAGQHHLVEIVAPAGRVDDLEVIRPAQHRLDRTAGAHLALEAFADALHIDFGAAGHGAPERPVMDREQAVIGKEAQKAAGREAEHVGQRRRPDRGRHRQQIVLAEGAAIAASCEEVAEAQASLLGGQPTPALGVEAQDVGQHPMEARPHQVAALGEQSPEGGAGIFDTTAIDADAERHVAGVAGHAQLLEQLAKIGIIALVEHDEAGVDRPVLALPPDARRIAVAAQPGFGLIERDVVALPQQPSRRQPGDAAADDCHPHSAPRSM